MALTTNRTFGIEIECVGNVYGDAVYTALRSADCSHWEIKGDGSLRPENSGHYCGHEIVSPVLSGEAGIAEVVKVVGILTNLGLTVNASCGFHVHVGADGLEAADLANLVVQYAKAEPEIDRLMPRARRGNNNHYCGTMSTVSEAARLIMRDRRGSPSTRDIISGVTRGERYFKLNLDAYLRHGTVEFRHHSGTVDARKIVSWIRFCVNFVERCKVSDRLTVQTETRYVAPAPAQAAPQSRDFTARVLDLARSSVRYNTRQRQLLVGMALAGVSGMTDRALAEVSGYAEASLPAILSGMRRTGMEIRRDRRRGTYRLVTINGRWLGDLREEARNVPTVAPPVQPPREVRETRNNFDSLANEPFDIFAGLEPETLSYFVERRAEMA